ncbi:hypothetical protein HMPREF1979_01599 [Actinomyces johnsonii F0542]|uniref:Uncharacterized protein n=1 Tax=Actinomyces johnsonii F0542 TaxID=1321818 RepID=U1RWB8_9ACTO|nr:hypothetical protein HMPREF1979_01599 [Actinomyces johnsonii F0542]
MVWATLSFSEESRFLRSCQSFGTAKVRPVLEPVISWVSPEAGFADEPAWLGEVSLVAVFLSLLSLSLLSLSFVSLLLESAELSEAAELEELESCVLSSQAVRTGAVMSVRLAIRAAAVRAVDMMLQCVRGKTLPGHHTWLGVFHGETSPITGSGVLKGRRGIVLMGRCL